MRMTFSLIRNACNRCINRHQEARPHEEDAMQWHTLFFVTSLTNAYATNSHANNTHTNNKIENKLNTVITNLTNSHSLKVSRTSIMVTVALGSTHT